MRIHINHLFMAVPELTFNLNFVQTLLEYEIISQQQFDTFLDGRRIVRRSGKVVRALSSGSVIERLMAVAPELLTVEVVDILSGVRFERRLIGGNKMVPIINTTQAHSLRIAIRTLKAATRGGLPTDSTQIFSRMSGILGAQLSHEQIDLWRSMNLITVGEANRYHGFLTSGVAIKDSIVKVQRAKSLLDALLLLSQGQVTKSLVAGMVKAGILSPRVGRVYGKALDLGVKEWKVFSGASAAKGYQQRLALILTGSFNRELLDFMVTTKVINKRQWASLQIGEILARRVNDRLLQDLTARRYRVKPGEAPIRTFARASRMNDQDLLRLLAQAARESHKEALALAGTPGIGGKTRGRQYTFAARGLHEAMHSVWEGVGYLTIWGESEVAEAAIESAAAMQASLLKGDFKGLEKALIWQAKAGVDSYISRKENTLSLSRSVYGNATLWSGVVDKRINLGLLQGKSAAEIAKDVAKFINPDVPGGVSYAAMRLARTEINNAFHYSTIRHTRELPWVRGYKWNLSDSHPRPDNCNLYASRDVGLGRGVFKKSEVPGKPHPHCLCYITTVQMSQAEFLAANNAGRFDRYYKQVAKGQAYESTPMALDEIRTFDIPALLRRYVDFR